MPKPRSEGADLSRMGLGSAAGPAGAAGRAAAGGGAYPPAAAAAAPPAPAAAAAPAAVAVPPVALPQPVADFKPALREITEASKLTKSATSALQFEDVTTAVRLLTEALTMLTQPPRK